MLCTLIGAIILSINIQVGLNMHLYDDIGDASSSLRGSTSSYLSVKTCKLLDNRPLFLCSASLAFHSKQQQKFCILLTDSSYHTSFGRRFFDWDHLSFIPLVWYILLLGRYTSPSGISSSGYTTGSPSLLGALFLLSIHRQIHLL